MKERENLLIYNHKFFLISETFVYQQASDLSEHFDVHLLSREFDNPHGFDMEKFSTHQIDRPKSLIDRAFGKIFRTVHDMNLNLGLRSYLDVRKLFRNHRFLAIHAHFGHNGLEVLGLAKAFRIPLVVTFHGHDASTMLNDRQYKRRLPELFEYASDIIIVSRHMIRTLELDPWQDKVHVIPCSVDPGKFSVNREVKKEFSGRIKILHAGRIVTTKGVPDVVKVFNELAAEYENIELHIAGDGSQLEECRQLAREAGFADRITFYGRVSHDEIKSLMQETDIFVLNSRTDHRGDMEGTPVSILEAMCMGNPVVSTIHAGIPDVINHGKNGLLAHEYANDELKQNIEQLIKSEALRIRLGEEARKTIHSSFTNHVMQQKINRIFDQIAAKRRSIANG